MFEVLQSAYSYVVGQLFGPPEDQSQADPAASAEGAGAVAKKDDVAQKDSTASGEQPKRPASAEKSQGSPNGHATRNQSVDNSAEEGTKEEKLRAPGVSPGKRRRAEAKNNVSSNGATHSPRVASPKRKTRAKSPAKASPAKRQRQQSGVFDVERIIGKRLDSKGAPQYLIRWQGYDSDEDSWEPAKNIFSKDLIEQFEQSTSS